MNSSPRILAGVALAMLLPGRVAAAQSEPLPDGAAVYAEACARCHDGGLSGLIYRAPRRGSGFWAPRLEAAGYDTLLANTLGGVGRMPAQGGPNGLTDAQVRAALDHLLAPATTP